MKTVKKILFAALLALSIWPVRVFLKRSVKSTLVPYIPEWAWYVATFVIFAVALIYFLTRPES